MPRWFKSLRRQARLHAHREARPQRVSRWTRNQHTPYRLETLEPRMLLSGTLSDGLQSYWQLNDNAGVIAVDAVATNDLNVQNGATLDPAAGRLDGALSFDGIDDKAEAGGVLDPLSGDYSVGFWFKRSDTSAFSSYQTLISKGNRYSTREGFSINLAGTTDEINIRVNSSDSTAERASTEVDMPQDDEWHHLLMVIDRTDGRVRGYLDGSNSGWRSGGGGPSSSNISGLTKIDTDDPLTLGAVRDGSGTYSHFDGSIDDVRIYDRALTASEAFSLANPPELESGLLAHYRADEASGTTTADELGTNDLTLINGATFDASGGRLDGALSFDGVDDKAEAGDVFDPGTGDYTASLWFKRPQGGALQSDQVLISKGNRYSTREGWSVNFSDSTQEIRFRVNSSDDSSERASIEVDVPQDDEWHHLVLTIDHATNKLVGYLDGDSSVWRSGGGGPSSSSLSSITDIDTDDPFTIGAVRDGANTYYEFEGLVDEVRLYDRVLTEVEIAALGDPVAAPETSVQIAGDIEVEAYTGYVLGLDVENPDPDNPIDEWIIDWGDGTAPEVVIGSPTSVTHFYETPRESSYLVTATANAIADNGTVTSYTAEAAIALLVTPSTVVDTDKDGLVDFGEQTAGTDPENPDTDGDLFLDGFEVTNYNIEAGFFDPLAYDDGTEDYDADRLFNYDEYFVYNTNPAKANSTGQVGNDGLVDDDSDGDLIADDWEVVHGLDPLVANGSYYYDVPTASYISDYVDTDGDGLHDLDEFVYGGDPLETDTNSDGVLDGAAFADGLEIGLETYSGTQGFGGSGFAIAAASTSASSGSQVNVPLWVTIGDWSPSESEMWRIKIGDTPWQNAVSRTDTIPQRRFFTPGEYTVQVDYVDTNRPEDSSPYDYRALIRENSGTPWNTGNTWLSGDTYFITGSTGILADRGTGQPSGTAILNVPGVDIALAEGEYVAAGAQHFIPVDITLASSPKMQGPWI